MAKITIFGDFKADNIEHLNLSGELTYLLNTSDVNIVNFEAPIHTDAEAIKKSGPNISQAEDSPEWLELRGFNVISLANNHIMDYGIEGYRQTKDKFRKSILCGAGEWEEAYAMKTITTKDGLNIGVLCCTHCEFGTLTDKMSSKNSSGVAWALHNEIAKKIINSGGGKLTS